MNQPSNDGRELSRLYTAAEQPEPPPALDAAILAASRRAVGAGPRRAQDRRRWEVPLALAATVVLTVSVTLLVHEERPYGDAGDAGVPPLAAPDASSARKKAESAAKPAYAPVPSGPAGPAAQPALAPAKPAAALPAPERADKVAPSVLQAAPAAPGRAADMAPAEAGANLGRIAEPASAPPASATNPAAAPAAAMRAPAPALMEKRALSSTSPGPAADSLARDEKSPERWIVEIRELRRVGRSAEAADKLAEFSKRFPGYSLPDDLK